MKGTIVKIADFVEEHGSADLLDLVDEQGFKDLEGLWHYETIQELWEKAPPHILVWIATRPSVLSPSDLVCLATVCLRTMSYSCGQGRLNVGGAIHSYKATEVYADNHFCRPACVAAFRTFKHTVRARRLSIEDGSMTERDHNSIMAHIAHVLREHCQPIFEPSLGV